MALWDQRHNEVNGWNNGDFRSHKTEGQDGDVGQASSYAKDGLIYTVLKKKEVKSTKRIILLHCFSRVWLCKGLGA